MLNNQRVSPPEKPQPGSKKKPGVVCLKAGTPVFSSIFLFLPSAGHGGQQSAIGHRNTNGSNLYETYMEPIWTYILLLY